MTNLMRVWLTNLDMLARFRIVRMPSGGSRRLLWLRRHHLMHVIAQVTCNTAFNATSENNNLPPMYIAYPIPDLMV